MLLFCNTVRNCLGRHLAYLEMRLILAILLWHFNFEQVDKNHRWKKQQSFLLWQKGSLKVRIKNRSGEVATSLEKAIYLPTYEDFDAVGMNWG